MACTGVTVRRFGQLQTLYAELTKKFGDNVNVHASEGPSLILTVAFINSPLNEKSQPDRGMRAVETAQFIKTRYPLIQSVREIWIVFVRQQTRFFVFHNSHTVEAYAFDKEANALHQPPDGPPPPPDENATTARYHPNTNETDISIEPIQLEGEQGGLGLTLLPHFKVSGDLKKAPPKPPKEVAFDLASFAERPRFTEPVPITFIADGKPVFETKGTFVGNETAFCYLTVPYSAYRRMIASSQLTIKLGDKEYPLPPKRFEALQKMNHYVTE